MVFENPRFSTRRPRLPPGGVPGEKPLVFGSARAKNMTFFIFAINTHTHTQTHTHTHAHTVTAKPLNSTCQNRPGTRLGLPAQHTWSWFHICKSRGILKFGSFSFSVVSFCETDFTPTQCPTGAYRLYACSYTQTFLPGHLHAWPHTHTHTHTYYTKNFTFSEENFLKIFLYIYIKIFQYTFIFLKFHWISSQSRQSNLLPAWNQDIVSPKPQ